MLVRCLSLFTWIIGSVGIFIDIPPQHHRLLETTNTSIACLSLPVLSSSVAVFTFSRSDFWLYWTITHCLFLPHKGRFSRTVGNLNLYKAFKTLHVRLDRCPIWERVVATISLLLFETDGNDDCQERFIKQVQTWPLTTSVIFLFPCMPSSFCGLQERTWAFQ